MKYLNIINGVDVMAKTLNTKIIIRNDSTTNWEANSTTVLDKGEMGIELLDGGKAKIKIGDGTTTWANLPYAGGDEAKTFHVGDLSEIPEGEELNVGDTAVVKTLIADDKYSYTGYVWNGSDWAAMDGNYDAENVYFSEDLMYTKAIGELAAVGSSGSATLAAKGKNVKDVLTAILAKRSQPTKNEPAVTLGGTQGNQDVEIGTTITKSGTMTTALSAGSYTYGPATGITATGWTTKVEYTQGKSGEITSGTSNSLPYNYSFQMGTDGQTIKVKFSATATHGAGTIANDSFGDESSPTIQIAAGSKSKEAIATYSCYRKMFYGTRTDTEELDSAKIRALTGEKAAAKANNSLSISIPVGAKRVVVAVPSGRSVTSVKDVNDSNAEVMSAFVTQTISVEGAEGYQAVDYTVYVCDYAAPAAVANTYKVTVA